MLRFSMEAQTLAVFWWGLGEGLFEEQLGWISISVRDVALSQPLKVL